MATKFTEDQTNSIVGTYVAAADAGDSYDERTAVVKALAAELGATENQIRGKLVSEGVYIKKEVTKSTTTRVDKEAIAVAFEAAFGIKIKSIRNMTGKDMQAFWDRFVEMSAVRDAEEGKK